MLDKAVAERIVHDYKVQLLILKIAYVPYPLTLNSLKNQTYLKF